MITIKQLGGDYGLQKLFGTFGAIIWGPVMSSTYLKMVFYMQCASVMQCNLQGLLGTSHMQCIATIHNSPRMWRWAPLA